MMIQIIFFSFLFSLQVYARPEIKIPETVEVSQRELLRLGDIAVVTGGNEDLVHRLDEVVIRTDARELLLSQYLMMDEIRIKLRDGLGVVGRGSSLNPSFKIPSRIKVEFSTTPISRQEVERKVTNLLLSRCGDCEVRVSVQSTPVPSDKGWDIDLREISTKGSFLIPVRELNQGTVRWIAGSAKLSKRVPVALRLINQGERISPSDVKLSLVDITFAKDEVLRVEDVEGHQAARSLSVGTPIWSSDLLREPAAKRGQMVKAILGDEVLEISVPVQAEEAGFVGDYIKVKNIETQKLLSGLLVDKGVVKLQ